MDACNPAAGSRIGWLRSDCGRPEWRRCIGLVVGLSLMGCRADPNMQLVERELRLQDSRIFELEAHLADCHSAALGYRREIASLKRQLGDEDSVGDAEKSPLDGDLDLRPDFPAVPEMPNVEEGDERAYRPRASTLDDAPSLENDREPPPGSMDMPDSVPSSGGPPQPTPAAPQQGMSFPEIPHGDSASDVAPVSEELPPPNLTGAADEIDQIHLRLMVRYQAVENVPVQLQALVQPQDEDARHVLAAGDVSLKVVALEDHEERQLVRWDFARQDARQRWQRSRLGKGLHFALPWPGPPRPGAYRLWVRLVGADGRKHFGSADFEIEEGALAKGPELTLPAVDAERTRQAGPTPAKRRDHKVEAAPQEEAQPEVAWKPSVLAARLVKPRSTMPFPATSGEARGAEPASDDRLMPWSPERPSAAGDSGAVQTANDGSDWSPYR